MGSYFRIPSWNSWYFSEWVEDGGYLREKEREVQDSSWVCCSPPPPMQCVPSLSWAANEGGLLSPCHRLRRRGPDSTDSFVSVSWRFWGRARTQIQKGSTKGPMIFMFWRENLLGCGREVNPFHPESKAIGIRRKQRRAEVGFGARGLCVRLGPHVHNYVPLLVWTMLFYLPSPPPDFKSNKGLWQKVGAI